MERKTQSIMSTYSGKKQPHQHMKAREGHGRRDHKTVNKIVEQLDHAELLLENLVQAWDDNKNLERIERIVLTARKYLGQ